MFVALDSGDPYPPTTSGSGGDFSSGTTSLTSPAGGSGGDFSSGGTNAYLPPGSPTPTTTSTGTSAGTTRTGTTSSSTTSSTSTAGARHTSSSSGTSGSSGTTTRTRIVTTTLVPHPVRVHWKSTNAGGNGPAPLGFISTAGITSHDRRTHVPGSLHVAPHRRTT